MTTAATLIATSPGQPNNANNDGCSEGDELFLLCSSKSILLLSIYTLMRLPCTQLFGF